MRIKRSTVGGLAASGVAVAALVGGPAVAGASAAGAGTDGVNATHGTYRTVEPARAYAQDGHDDMHRMAKRMLHGEFVIPRAGGDGYERVLVQRGSVQSVSQSELTVESADGFRETYDISQDTLVKAGPGGMGSVERGDTVHVVATISGDRATAVHVSDISHVKELMEQFRQDQDQ
ncbi:MAG TPA: hypothetical protein VIL34_17015 [Actinopolymorphaceae bacterium]|jgi:hypothetical protein